jgi:hypothetical protein
MDYMFDGLIGMDVSEDDLPRNNDPVIILGKTYSSIQGWHIYFSLFWLAVTYLIINLRPSQSWTQSAETSRHAFGSPTAAISLASAQISFLPTKDGVACCDAAK